jgi:hypothetical protein|tara:strand:- start:8985 stop:9329 length:345 start_codon:yes stop_codon:yes gene_type:complete
MLLTQGRTQIRSQISNDLTHGQAGTDVTLPTAGDTALGAAVAATNNALDDVQAGGNTITVTHIVLTTEGNGSTLAEWEILANTTVDFNRVVKAGVAKTVSIEVTMIQTFVIEIS